MSAGTSLGAGTVRWRRLKLSAILAVVVVCLVPTESSASFKKGLLDFDFSSEAVFNDARAARADFVRLNLSWRGAALSEPANPTDPGAPEYDFSSTDAAVRDAAARDLDVLLTVTAAPNFAEGNGRPGNATPGTWKPDPEKFGKFAEAVAARYSG